MSQFKKEIKAAGLDISTIEKDLSKLSDPQARQRLRQWAFKNGFNAKSAEARGLLLTLLHDFGREPNELNAKGPNKLYLARFAKQFADPIGNPTLDHPEEKKEIAKKKVVPADLPHLKHLKKELDEQQRRALAGTGKKANIGTGTGSESDHIAVRPTRPLFETIPFDPKKWHELDKNAKRTSIELACPQPPFRPFNKIKLFEIPKDASLESKMRLISRNRDIIYELLLSLSLQPRLLSREKIEANALRIFWNRFELATKSDTRIKLKFPADVLLLADRAVRRFGQEGHNHFLAKAILALESSQYAGKKSLLEIIRRIYDNSSTPSEKDLNGIRKGAYDLLQHCTAHTTRCTEATYNSASLLISLANNKWEALRKSPKNGKAPSLLTQSNNAQYLAKCANQNFFGKNIVRDIPPKVDVKTAKDLVEQNAVNFYRVAEKLDDSVKLNASSFLDPSIAFYYKGLTKGRNLAQDLSSGRVTLSKLRTAVLRSLLTEYKRSFEQATKNHSVDATELSAQAVVLADRAFGDDGYTRFLSLAKKQLRRHGLSPHLDGFTKSADKRKEIATWAIQNSHNWRAGSVLALLRRIAADYGTKPNHLTPPGGNRAYKFYDSILDLRYRNKFSLPIARWTDKYQFGVPEQKHLLVPKSPFMDVDKATSLSHAGQIMEHNKNLVHQAIDKLKEFYKGIDIHTFAMTFGRYYQDRTDKPFKKEISSDQFRKIILETTELVLKDYKKLFERTVSKFPSKERLTNVLSLDSLMLAKAAGVKGNYTIWRFDGVLSRLDPKARKEIRGVLKSAGLGALVLSNAFKGFFMANNRLQTAAALRERLLSMYPQINKIEPELGEALAAFIVAHIDDQGFPPRLMREMEFADQLSFSRYNDVNASKLIAKELEARKYLAESWKTRQKELPESASPETVKRILSREIQQGRVVPTEIRQQLLNLYHPLTAFKKANAFVQRLEKFDPKKLPELIRWGDSLGKIANHGRESGEDLYSLLGSFNNRVANQAKVDQVEGVDRDRTRRSKAFVLKTPLTRRELSGLFDNYYQRKRGWRLSDEMKAAHRDLDKRATDDEKRVLLRLFEEDDLGIKKFVARSSFDFRQTPAERFISVQWAEAIARAKFAEMAESLANPRIKDKDLANHIQQFVFHGHVGTEKDSLKLAKLYRMIQSLQGMKFNDPKLAEALAKAFVLKGYKKEDALKRANWYRVFNLEQPGDTTDFLFNRMTPDKTVSIPPKEVLDEMKQVSKVFEWVGTFGGDSRWQAIHAGRLRDYLRGRMKELDQKSNRNSYIETAFQNAVTEKNAHAMEIIRKIRDSERYYLQKLFRSAPKMKDVAKKEKKIKGLLITTHDREGTWKAQLENWVLVGVRRHIEEVLFQYDKNNKRKRTSPKDRDRALHQILPVKIQHWDFVGAQYYEKFAWWKLIQGQLGKNYKEFFALREQTPGSDRYKRVLHHLRGILMKELRDIRAGKKTQFFDVENPTKEDRLYAQYAVSNVIRAIDHGLVMSQVGKADDNVLEYLKGELSGRIQDYHKSLLQEKPHFDWEQGDFRFDLPSTTIVKIQKLSPIHQEILKRGFYRTMFGATSPQLETHESQKAKSHALRMILSQSLDQAAEGLYNKKGVEHADFGFLLRLVERNLPFADKLKKAWKGIRKGPDEKLAMPGLASQLFKQGARREADRLEHYRQKILHNTRILHRLDPAEMESFRATLIDQLRTLEKYPPADEKDHPQWKNEKDTTVLLLNIIDGRGHRSAAKRDPRYLEAEEHFNQPNSMFDPKKWLEEQQKLERDLKRAGCEKPKPPLHCQKLKYYVKFAADLDHNGGGRGLSPMARRKFISGELTKFDFDRLDRLERIATSMKDDLAKEAATNALMVALMNATPEQIAATSKMWDPLFHQYLVDFPQLQLFEDKVVRDLQSWVERAEVLVENADKREVKECGKNKEHPILGLSAATKPIDFDTNLEKLVRINAIGQAMVSLQETGKYRTAPVEELESLVDAITPRVREEVEFGVRQKVAKLLLGEALLESKAIAGSIPEQLGVHESSSKLGCQLRGLLNPSLRINARKAFKREAEQKVHAMKNPENDKPYKPDTELYKKKLKEELDKIAKLPKYHQKVEGDFGRLVARKRFNQKGVQPTDLGKKVQIRSWLTEHMGKCIEDLEKKPRALEKKAAALEKQARGKFDAGDRAGAETLLAQAKKLREAADKARPPSLEWKIDAEFKKMRKMFHEGMEKLRSARLRQERGRSKIALDAAYVARELETVQNRLEGLRKFRQEKKYDDFPEKLKKRHKEKIEKTEKTERELKFKLFEANLRLGVMPRPLSSDTPKEEREFQEWGTKYISKVVDKLLDTIPNHVKGYKKLPEPEYWQGKNFVGLTSKTADYIKAWSLDEVKKEKEAKEPTLPTGDYKPGKKLITELVKIRMDSKVLELEIEMRSEFLRKLQKDLRETAARRYAKAREGSDQEYLALADKCLKLLSDKKVKFPFKMVEIPQYDPDDPDSGPADREVYEDDDERYFMFEDASLAPVADVLKDYRIRQQAAEKFFDGIQVPIGTDAKLVRGKGGDEFTDTITFGPHVNAFNELLDGFAHAKESSFKLSERETLDHFRQMYDRSKLERDIKDKDLRKVLKNLAPFGLKWDGSQLLYKDAKLWKIGKIAGAKIQSLSDFKKEMEKLASFGIYAESGTDPWKNLMELLRSQYIRNYFAGRFEMRVIGSVIDVKPRKKGTNLDFMTDHFNGEKYLTLRDPGPVRKHAQGLVDEIQKTHKTYADQFKNVLGLSNALLQVVGTHKVGEHGWMGEKLANAYKELEATRKKLEGLIPKVEAEGIVEVEYKIKDKKGNDKIIKRSARDIAHMNQNTLRYDINPDFKALPDQVHENVVDGRWFLGEMIVVEALTIPLDILTAGGTRGAKTLLWTYRVAKGVNLAYKSTLVGKIIIDNYMNIRYPKAYHQAMPWASAREGAHKSAILFGGLPVIHGASAALRIPHAIGGPAGMFALTYGVERGFGADHDHALKHAVRAIPYGLSGIASLGESSRRSPTRDIVCACNAYLEALLRTLVSSDTVLC